MQEQTLLAVAILLCATVVLGSCQGDADQTRNADELEKISRSTPADRGAPGNPRGPTDPSR
jgi:hypothetical protein